MKTVLWLVTAGLLLTVFGWWAFSNPPQGRDPIAEALQASPKTGNRTAGVRLTPQLLERGATYDATARYLEGLGYELFADHTDAPNWWDEMYLNEGVTHTFRRSGRWNVVCGEGLFVHLTVEDGYLTRATGFSEWTCL